MRTAHIRLQCSLQFSYPAKAKIIIYADVKKAFMDGVHKSWPLVNTGVAREYPYMANTWRWAMASCRVLASSKTSNSKLHCFHTPKRAVALRGNLPGSPGVQSWLGEEMHRWSEGRERRGEGGEKETEMIPRIKHPGNPTQTSNQWHFPFRGHMKKIIQAPRCDEANLLGPDQEIGIPPTHPNLLLS